MKRIKYGLLLILFLISSKVFVQAEENQNQSKLITVRVVNSNSAKSARIIINDGTDKGKRIIPLNPILTNEPLNENDKKVASLLNDFFSLGYKLVSSHAGSVKEYHFFETYIFLKTDN